jgi:hypothetical protein
MDDEDAEVRASKRAARHTGSRRSEPRLRALAQRLIGYEAMRSDPSAPGVPEAFSRVVEKLRPPLATFTGQAGFSALLSRALTLASREARWLRAVRVEAEGSMHYRSDIAPPGREHLAKGEVALVAQLLSLLVSFIGEPLTLRVLQDVWSTARIDELGSGTEDQ